MEPTFSGQMWLPELDNSSIRGVEAAPVEGELVEPHGAHEGDVGELVVEQLSLLLRGVHHPQSGQFLKDDSLK